MAWQQRLGWLIMVCFLSGGIGIHWLSFDYNMAKNVLGDRPQAHSGLSEGWLLLGIKDGEIQGVRADLEAMLQAMPHTDSVISLAHLKLPWGLGPLIAEKSALQPNEKYPNPNVAAHFLVDRRLYDRRDSSWLYLAKPKEGLSQEKHEQIYKALKALKTKEPGLKAIGKSVWQHHFFNALKTDALRLAVIGLSLLLIFCWRFIRPLRMVGYIALTLLAGLCAWLGLLALFGPPLHLLLGLSPALILALGISQCWHLIQGEKRSEKPNLRGVWMSGLSSIIALLALTTTPLPMVQSFGFWTALGIGLQTFCIGFFLAPKFVSFEAAFRGHAPALKWVGWWPLLLFPCLSAGLFFLKTDVSWHQELYSNHSLKEEEQWFEHRMGGTIPYLFSTQAPEADCMQDSGCLRSLESMERELQSHYNLGPLWSPLDALRLAAQQHGKSPWGSHGIIPLDAQEQTLVPHYLRGLERRLGHPLKNEQNWFWLAPGPARGTSALSDLNSGKLPKPQGLFFDGPRHASDLIKSLTYSLPLSFAGLWLLFVFAFGFKTGSLAWCSNLLPPAALAGLAGLVGLPLNLALLVALVVVSGLAADDSLHLMVSYNTQKSTGYPKSAWKRALLTKSRAMYLSSLTLGIGLLPLAWSSLQTSAQFCLYMWFGMALAWLVDQWLLPLMLAFVGKRV